MEGRKSQRIREKIVKVKSDKEKQQKKENPIEGLEDLIKKMKARNPKGNMIYETPYKIGMDYLKRKKSIEVRLLDYMGKYDKAAMLQSKDESALNDLLNKYGFFVRCIIYGFKHGDFKGTEREYKANLYKKFGHGIVDLGKHLDIIGNTQQADRIYLLFGQCYIDGILLNNRGNFDIKKLVNIKQIEEDYGKDIVLRITEAGQRTGKEPVISQKMIWLLEARKIREEYEKASKLKKLQDSIAK